jgi:DNA polymerase III alpha subunit
MIHLEGRQLMPDGTVICSVPVLRESLYNTGTWYHNAQCSDNLEVSLYNNALKLLDVPWAQLNSQTEFDHTQWMTPKPWCSCDIDTWCRSQCHTEEQHARCEMELELFRERGLTQVLQQLKYLVDHWRQHNIVWGVGRGSSISSYVLYLIGIHKINPLLYGLDCTEFFKQKEK